MCSPATRRQLASAIIASSTGLRWFTCDQVIFVTLVFLTYWIVWKLTTPSFLMWQSRSKIAGSVNTSALARPSPPMTIIWGRSIFLELVWSVSSRGSVFGWTRQHMQGREIALTIGCCIYTRPVESKSLEVGKSLKIGKNRIKSEKSEFIFY